MHTSGREVLSPRPKLRAKGIGIGMRRRVLIAAVVLMGALTSCATTKDSLGTVDTTNAPTTTIRRGNEFDNHHHRVTGNNDDRTTAHDHDDGTTASTIASTTSTTSTTAAAASAHPLRTE